MVQGETLRQGKEGAKIRGIGMRAARVLQSVYCDHFTGEAPEDHDKVVDCPAFSLFYSFAALSTPARY